MNLSNPNDDTPNLDPGTQKAMDGLLSEFARSKTANDDAFLSSLDAALDAAVAETPPPGAAMAENASDKVKTHNPPRSPWKWGLLGSAAAGIGIGLFAWKGYQQAPEHLAYEEKHRGLKAVPAQTDSEYITRMKEDKNTNAKQVESASTVTSTPLLPVSLPVSQPTPADPSTPAPPQAELNEAMPVNQTTPQVSDAFQRDSRFKAMEEKVFDGTDESIATKALPATKTPVTLDTTLSTITMPNSDLTLAQKSGGLGGGGSGGGEGSIAGRGRGGLMGAGFGHDFGPGGTGLAKRNFTAGYYYADGERDFRDGEARRETAGPSADKYDPSIENAFLSPLKAPLSTFSIDVDTASYANLRRMITQGEAVPPAAVRIEEMVNYFSYSYPQAEGEHPFTTHVETASCPWAEVHRLVKIGIKAKEIAKEKRPSANLVFLCDVSGSMNSPDKLPLLVENLKVLTNELNADDTVGIVVYAGNEGVALEPTTGGDKQRILQALNGLSSGGSTNGGAGITRAYQMAQQRFIKGGINRVVLCTDGDFNVGTTSQEQLVSLVEEKAKGGVFLTVCGYGRGNLNDAMMEAITNKGNGVYHYVDSEKEGRKIFKDELFGTLMTVAKDVKLQVEFNPGKVGSYRLIGYDNRMLKKEDFANDKVDAGDIGAGHTVTALYEIIPPGVPTPEGPIPGLKYQKPQPVVSDPATATPAPAVEPSPELLTVNLRYKQPEGTESKLLSLPHSDEGRKIDTASSDFRFAATVAEFGEWLRGKRNEGRSIQRILEQAESSRGNDPHGLRAEFIELVKKASTTVRD